MLLVVSRTPTLQRELDRMSWVMVPMGGGYYRVPATFFPTYVGVIDEISEAERSTTRCRTRSEGAE